MKATTKGQMVKELKSNGIRKALKSTGEEVQLEHLKYAEVVKLYNDNITE